MSDLVRLRRHSDERGHLVAVAAGTDVPFVIRRVFWIYGNTEGQARAGHAHRAMTEMLVCLAGRCEVIIEDASGVRSITLDRPDAAVLVPPLSWIDLTEFSADCVLMVLADHDYDPDGVITDRAHVRAGTAG